MIKWFATKIVDILIFGMLLHITLAVETEPVKDAPMLLEFEINKTDTSNSFKYALTDGQTRAETVEIVNKGMPDEHIEVNGSYSYVINGDKYDVSYTAGKEGYRAKVQKVPQSTKRISPNILKTLVG